MTILFLYTYMWYIYVMNILSSSWHVLWVVLVIKIQLYTYLAWIRTSVSRASVSCRVCMSRFSASPRKRSNLLRAEPWVFLSTISSSCRMVEFSSLMMKNIKKIYLFSHEWNYYTPDLISTLLSWAQFTWSGTCPGLFVGAENTCFETVIVSGMWSVFTNADRSFGGFIFLQDLPNES